MNTALRDFAFLPVHKPVGPTSHGVVARLRRLMPRKHKVGHTGTLDPFASGVMILALGKGTRFADDVHCLDKAYRAVIRLGEETDTLDPEGEVIHRADVPDFNDGALQEIAARFTGEQDQIPPIYSAKRVDGKRSYDLARADQAVALKPSRITIHELRLARQDAQHLICDVRCSTGAYIRALGRDIAIALGTRGYLTELVRTAVGPVTLDACTPLDDLDGDALNLMAVADLIPDLEEMSVDAEIAQFLANGRPWPTETVYPEDFLAVHRDHDQVQAIFRCTYSDDAIRPKMLCYQA